MKRLLFALALLGLLPSFAAARRWETVVSPELAAVYCVTENGHYVNSFYGNGPDGQLVPYVDDLSQIGFCRVVRTHPAK